MNMDLLGLMKDAATIVGGALLLWCAVIALLWVGDRILVRLYRIQARRYEEEETSWNNGRKR
jgi:hypothetical protein